MDLIVEYKKLQQAKEESEQRETEILLELDAILSPLNLFAEEVL